MSSTAGWSLRKLQAERESLSLEMEPIYLDHNASTLPEPEVVEAMIEWLGSKHANPHSIHFHGTRAFRAVEGAVASIGSLLGADANEIILTSGATEASNLALQGFFRTVEKGASLFVSDVEHKCVLETAAYLKSTGVSVNRIQVDEVGRVDPRVIVSDVKSCSVGPCLVSVMHANNEVGTIQPIRDIVDGLVGTSARVHTDAAQSFGRLSFTVEDLGVDFVSMSAHKMGGPPGIGALYVSQSVRDELQPLMFGGSQQGGLRPGTIPVFLAVGFGVACDLAAQRLRSDALSREKAADAFVRVLQELRVKFEVLGDSRYRNPGVRSIRFHGMDSGDLLLRVRNHVSASAGAACSGVSLIESHVLAALNLDEGAARQVVRFGFGRTTAIQESERAAMSIGSVIRQIEGELDRS